MKKRKYSRSTFAALGTAKRSRKTSLDALPILPSIRQLLGYSYHEWSTMFKYQPVPLLERFWSDSPISRSLSGCISDIFRPIIEFRREIDAVMIHTRIGRSSYADRRGAVTPVILRRLGEHEVILLMIYEIFIIYGYCS